VNQNTELLIKRLERTRERETGGDYLIGSLLVQEKGPIVSEEKPICGSIQAYLRVSSELIRNSIRLLIPAQQTTVIATCINVEPDASCGHERPLRRPAQEDSRNQRTRDADRRSRSHLRCGPLLGKALRQDGARRGSLRPNSRPGRSTPSGWCLWARWVRTPRFSTSCLAAQRREGTLLCAAQPRREHDAAREHDYRVYGAVRGGGGCDYEGRFRELRRTAPRARPQPWAGDHDG
jgi:hypothetical protein